MKTLLIVFAVLLLLLTLLSTFGGSIRANEPFYQEPAKDRNEYYYEAPISEQFSDVPGIPSDSISEEYQSPLAVSEQYQNGLPPVPEQFDEMPEDIKQEPFATLPPQPSIPDFKLPQVSAASSAKPSDATHAAPMQEGFMIEPFEEDKKVSFYASF